MMLVMIGGLSILILAAVVGTVALWRGDGYGSAASRAAYDSRSPHPADPGTRSSGW